ncbi:MAG: SOS response-associated peptidase [Comamonadaceae bacterium]|nr:SOS response-associated peptidase [Comamonadaceae bacterium]
MPSHHEPVTDAGRLFSAFGVVPTTDVQPVQRDADAILAPFIVPAEQPSCDALGELHMGLCGLLPAATPEAGLAARTRHCRVEAMKSDPTCRRSWWSGQRCIVPAERLTQWSYASGRPELWCIALADGQPMGLAGLWSARTGPDGETQRSFCLLTLNADGHAVFDRLHHPTQEKRMPVILPAQAQRQWLHGSGAQAERLLLRCPAEQLQALPLEPASWPSRADDPAEADLFPEAWWGLMSKAPRRKRIVARRGAPEAPLPITGDLFG